MNVEQLKKAISEAFEKAAEEAAKKILEEYPHKEIKEETETWEPGGIIRTSIGDLASEDYCEILEDGTKKTEFTWDEAMETEKKTNGKWRLPTIFEWDKLVDEFGDYLGKLDRDAFVNALELTKNEYGYGRYWASTRDSSTDGAYSLEVGRDYACRDVNLQEVWGSVRLIRNSK